MHKTLPLGVLRQEAPCTLSIRSPLGREVQTMSPAWCHLEITLDRGCWVWCRIPLSPQSLGLADTGTRKENGQPPSSVALRNRCLMRRRERALSAGQPSWGEQLPLWVQR